MIDRLYHHAGLSLIIAWMLLWPLTWFGLTIQPWAVLTAIGAGALLRETKVGNWTLAILGHLSFALVMFASAWLLARVGVEFPKTAIWAKSAYLAASLVFYLSVVSLIRLDLYALMYRAWVRVTLSAALIAYCLITADAFVALTLAGSLALYQARIGASNPLDHLHHFFVMIIVLVSL